MKSKIFIFVLFTCMSFTSCTLFENPAHAHRIGVGYIQNYEGLYFVEIDSVKYGIVEKLYTDISDYSAKKMTKPVEGLEITAFTLGESSKVNFVVGDVSEEYIEEKFTISNISDIMVIFFCFCCFLFTIFSIIKDQKKF